MITFSSQNLPKCFAEFLTTYTKECVCVRSFCVHLHLYFFWIWLGFFLHRSPVHFTFQLNLNCGKNVLWHLRLKIVLPARKKLHPPKNKTETTQIHKQTTSKNLLKYIVIKMIKKNQIWSISKCIQIKYFGTSCKGTEY